MHRTQAASPRSLGRFVNRPFLCKRRFPKATEPRALSLPACQPFGEAMISLRIYERARTGDPRAVAKILLALRPCLNRLAASYSRRCPEDAGDLEQEAWIAVLEALPGLDLAVRDPGAALLRYARWRVVDAVRRSLARQRAATVFSRDSAAGHAQDPSALAAPAIFVETLSPLQQHIVGLLVSGFTWREIGERLCCTSANVGYHVRRIAVRLKEFENERQTL